jgi:hypothetical protein
MGLCPHVPCVSVLGALAGLRGMCGGRHCDRLPFSARFLQDSQQTSIWLPGDPARTWQGLELYPPHIATLCLLLATGLARECAERQACAWSSFSRSLAPDRFDLRCKVAPM